MNLDHRAQRASRGIKAGISGVPIPPPPGTIASASAASGAPWMRAIAAAAAVVIVGAFVAMVAQPGVFAPATGGGDPSPVVVDTTTTTEPRATTTTEVQKETTTTQAPKAKATEPQKPTTTVAPKKAPTVDHAITITSPEEGIETEAKGITLRAEVTDGLEVKMHGVVVEAVDGVAEGYILLEPGWNELWVKGYADGEKVAYDTVKVFRIAPEPTKEPVEEKPAYAVEITSPASGTETDGDKVVVSGKATPGVGELKVHGNPVTVAADGSWSTEVWLSGGKNEIWAKLYVGGEKVAYDTTVVKKAVVESIAFTSHQVYGSCSENPPYDVFHGTATPGHEVKVWTDSYGYQKVQVGESGNWEIRFTFPETVASNTQIPIEVWNYTTGEKHQYSFVYQPTG